MTQFRAAPSTGAARWLLDSDVPWSTLVRFGPPGFEAYVRVAFAEDPGIDAVRSVLTTLTAFTVTPEHGYAAVWEGWGGREPAPSAPRVSIPHREMLLFAGPLRTLRDAPALAWYGEATGVAQEPHLVWPEDHAWCLACEVDEEVEFTVGCSVDAAHALEHDLPGAVRRVGYGEATPLYRRDNR